MNEAPTAPSRLPVIPGYELEEFVGKGGMGIVYRARHGATGRVVALKLISPRGASDEVARARFVREIRALAAIKHPNIVPLYDAGDWHGFPYCTMEFVAGGTLSDHLNRIRADLDGAVALMAKVARGVARLHSAGILHRDLKPLNILLSEGDEPLVADFGLAKWVGADSDLTVTGLPVGTRPYMAPEQTLGDKRLSTHACDVWSLGVTLYEVLTGQRPFNDDGFTGVYHFIRTAEPPPMTALSPDLPEALQAVVLKCLAKQPEDRYPSAAALAEDLDRWLRREPVLAPLPPPPGAGGGAAAPPLLSLGSDAQGVQRPKRRSRVPALGVGLVLAAFGVATLFPKQPAEPPVTEKAEAPTSNEPPQPTAAEKRERQFLFWAQQLAAGKKVFLTDDKGRPSVDPVDELERVLQRDQWDEYHSFSRHGIGIAN
ncbi:MAG TPA: serine/threonine-protein kinase, partial [Gemmata sp.]